MGRARSALVNIDWDKFLSSCETESLSTSPPCWSGGGRPCCGCAVLLTGWVTLRGLLCLHIECVLTWLSADFPASTRGGVHAIGFLEVAEGWRVPAGRPPVG